MKHLADVCNADPAVLGFILPYPQLLAMVCKVVAFIRFVNDVSAELSKGAASINHGSRKGNTKYRSNNDKSNVPEGAPSRHRRKAADDNAD